MDAVHAATGTDRDLIARVLEKIDVESSTLPDGFSRTRFPRSFKAASLALDAMAGWEFPDLKRAQMMYQLGDSVFDAPYPAYPGIHKLLRSYADHYKLVLVTKGEDTVQWRKIHLNKFDEFFTPQNTYVVLRKNKELFERIVEEQDLDIASSWMIGDSLRDDIGPAKAAGLRTVEIRSHTGRWGYETEAHAADITVLHTTDIVNYIPTRPKKYAYITDSDIRRPKFAHSK